jgi:hypothetical protein
MVLYNERSYAWERMMELDAIIDDNPTLDNVSQMVKDDIRNHLAFLELNNYSLHKRFLYKHPILQEYKLSNELDALRKANPERFMNELINADKNIIRYSSLIKHKKYKSEEEKLQWDRHIVDFTEKLSIMKKLIAQ